MSLTPLEKELLKFVKALSEACEQSNTDLASQIQFLSASFELLAQSQSEMLKALNQFASEQANYETLTESLQSATEQLLDAEKKLEELSRK